MCNILRDGHVYRDPDCTAKLDPIKQTLQGDKAICYMVLGAPKQGTECRSQKTALPSSGLLCFLHFYLLLVAAHACFWQS